MQTLNLNNILMRNENFVDSEIPYLSSIERNFCNLLYNQEKFSQRNNNTKQNSLELYKLSALLIYCIIS